MQSLISKPEPLETYNKLIHSTKKKKNGGKRETTPIQKKKKQGVGECALKNIQSYFNNTTKIP